MASSVSNSLSPSNTEYLSTTLVQASEFLNTGKYKAALDHYLNLIRLFPSITRQIHRELTLAFRKYGDILIEVKDMKSLTQLHQHMLQVIPSSDMIVNMMGAQLFSVGMHDEAAAYFLHALTLNPEQLAAQENLSNLSCHVLERWHFTMLNDIVRNKAYQRAIGRALSHHPTILDVGTGTGLLSMLAYRAGFKLIFTCEMSKTICKLAEQVICANNMKDRIILMEKCSLDIRIPEDMPQRVSLLVTETFDAGLLGENVLSMLDLAWENLLLPTAQVVPRSALVFVSAIECLHIRKQTRCLMPQYPHLSLNSLGLRSKLCHCTPDAEPYTTENLASLPMGFQLLTDPQALTNFNFESAQDIKQHLKGWSQELSLKVIHKGRVDALVMWYELRLDDNLMLSTRPGSDTAWEQAVFPVQLGQGTDLHVNPGEHFAITAICRDGLLHLRPTGLLQVDNLLTVDSDDMQNVNDIDFNLAQLRVLEGTDFTGQGVLHLSQNLSLLPLQLSAIDAGPQFVHGLSADSCLALRELAKLNELELPVDIQDKDLEMALRVPDSVQDTTTATHLVSLIIVDLIEPMGTLRLNALHNLALTTQLHLAESGSIMPIKLEIFGLPIESDELLSESCLLSNHSVFGLDIARHVNIFQVRNHPGINLRELRYHPLSQPSLLLSLDLTEHSKSSLPQYLNQNNISTFTASNSGSLHAVVYWFVIHLSEDVKVNTLAVSHHWKQAATIIPGEVVITKEHFFRLKTICRDSCLVIEVA